MDIIIANDNEAFIEFKEEATRRHIQTVRLEHDYLLIDQEDATSIADSLNGSLVDTGRLYNDRHIYEYNESIPLFEMPMIIIFSNDRARSEFIVAADIYSFPIYELEHTKQVIISYDHMRVIVDILDCDVKATKWNRIIELNERNNSMDEAVLMKFDNEVDRRIFTEGASEFVTSSMEDDNNTYLMINWDDMVSTIGSAGGMIINTEEYYLGLHILRYRREVNSNDDTDDTDTVDDSDGVKKYVVQIRDIDDHIVDLREYCREVLTKGFDNSIIVENRNGSVPSRWTGKSTMIRLYSSFTGSPTMTPPKEFKVFDRVLGPPSKDMFRCSDIYPPRIADINRTTLATFIIDEDGSLKEVRILVDLMSMTSEDATFLFKSIMNKLVEIMNMSSSDRSKVMQDMYISSLPDGRELFISYCNDSLTHQIGRLKNKINEARDDINSIMMSYTNAVRYLTDMNIELDMISGSAESNMERWSKEYDSILNINKVKNVAMKDSILDVFTKHIYCQCGKKIYDIGKFKISIDLKTNVRHPISICNLTRKIKGVNVDMNAPHVFSDGNPCLGDIGVAVSEYLGSYNISTVVLLLIQFLESVNTKDSAGKHITAWPEISEEDMKLAQEEEEEEYNASGSQQPMSNA